LKKKLIKNKREREIGEGDENPVQKKKKSKKDIMLELKNSQDLCKKYLDIIYNKDNEIKSLQQKLITLEDKLNKLNKDNEIKSLQQKVITLEVKLNKLNKKITDQDDIITNLEKVHKETKVIMFLLKKKRKKF
jgi:predicted  nucleic acid-binding Zn-ribbon protein